MKFTRTIISIFTCLLFLTQPVLADTVGLSEQPIVSQEQETAAGKTGEQAVEASTAENTADKTSAAALETTEAAAVAAPEIASEAGVLYDATRKKVLFSKNPDKQLYPASITKVMTVLLAAEKLKPEEVITFQASATENLESGYTNVGIVTGDQMTVKDAMYAVMLKSACEVSNGLAEKISGTQSAFAELMNKKAKELGCKNTQFRNASGLNDSEHLTTAYDMALITAAAVSNADFRKIVSTKSYTLPASKKRDSLKLTNSNKMLYSSNAEYVEGIIGGKTGYTSRAGNTLVEAAEENGHLLVAVVMKSTGKQYTDAKKLLEYGKQLVFASSAATGTEAEGKKTDSEETKALEGWEETSSGRKYRKADGTYAQGEWLRLDGEDYFFGADGICATGWKQFKNGAWYFFDQSTGAMVHKKWVSTDGRKYYYLQDNGVMAVDTVVDGVYRVDENGVYVEKVG